MGSAQSLVAPQNLIAAAILVAVVATGIWRNHANTDDASAAASSDKTVSKKGKKKKPAGRVQDSSSAASGKETSWAATPRSPPAARTVPGGILESEADALPASVSTSKPVNEKKRKPKKSGTPLPSPSSGSAAVAGPSRPSTGSESSTTPQPAMRPSTHTSTTEAWTRVESRRKTSGPNPSTSDAGVTTATSVEEDGSSSGAMERTVDERHDRSQKTLAEKLLPKGRKTAVDDMLETSDYPELSRVMRVTPAANEKPATGFSWGDYEDVEDVRDADADGEDDSGWGVVKSRGRAKHAQSSSSVASPPQTKAPETLTKKQRQNAAKRAADKAAKVDAEAERLAVLAKHKRDQERDRIAEQYAHKGPGSGRRNVSGGMTAIVDPNGKLVFDH